MSQSPVKTSSAPGSAGHERFLVRPAALDSSHWPIRIPFSRTVRGAHPISAVAIIGSSLPAGPSVPAGSLTDQISDHERVPRLHSLEAGTAEGGQGRKGEGLDDDDARHGRVERGACLHLHRQHDGRSGGKR